MLTRIVYPEELQSPANTSRINQSDLAQPLSTAFQIALYHQIQRFGVQPVATVGHSNGEIAAAYAAGYINLEYALATAFYRGSVVAAGGSSAGAMAAVGLSPDAISPFLQPGVCIACKNSPDSTTISGDRNAVTKVLESLRRDIPDVFSRILKVDVAYHSRECNLIHTFFELVDYRLTCGVFFFLPPPPQIMWNLWRGNTFAYSKPKTTCNAMPRPIRDSFSSLASRENAKTTKLCSGLGTGQTI